MVPTKRIKTGPDGGGPKRRANFTCGVYEIYHKPTKRSYIGSSSEIEKRLYLHVVCLRHGSHHCAFLQRTWTKHGEEGFQYYILEICDTDKLEKLEQFHMDRLRGPRLMNSQPYARSSRGFKHSEETRKKLSIAAKIRVSDPEHLKGMSKRAKAQHAIGNLGWATMTEDGREKVRVAGRRALAEIDPLIRARGLGDSKEMSRRSLCRRKYKELAKLTKTQKRNIVKTSKQDNKPGWSKILAEELGVSIDTIFQVIHRVRTVK